MSSAQTVYFDSQLPWVSSRSENATFFKISLICLLLTIAFAAYVLTSELPEVPRAEQERLPPQLAQLIQAKEPEPLPPQIEPEPEPEEEIIEEPEPEPIQEIEPTPIEAPEASPTPEPEPVEISEQEKVSQARETAKSSGVLQFTDQLASMRQQAQLNNLADTDLSEGGGEAEQTLRNVIAAPSLSASGGIQTGNLSSDVGAAGELEGRRNTEFVAATQGQAALATKRVETQQQVIGSRDLDLIRQTLDANKGAVYSLYRRALREDPSIEGKLTVRLVIEADGSLSAVTLVDSELEAPDLVAKLLSRISLINFGAANVTKTELDYSYNFLPF